MRKFGGDGIYRRADGGFDRRFGKIHGVSVSGLLILIIVGIAIVKVLFEEIDSMFAEFIFCEGA
tara:strand:- start:558 stop:749 length:192 start_codon:yes stop_codon:yes gene_type:complete